MINNKMVEETDKKNDDNLRDTAPIEFLSFIKISDPESGQIIKEIRGD